MFTHVGARRRRATAIITHWIWQEGGAQPDFIRWKLKTTCRSGSARGLGVELDWEQVRKAHDAYKSCRAARVMTRCNTIPAGRDRKRPVVTNSE